MFNRNQTNQINKTNIPGGAQLPSRGAEVISIRETNPFHPKDKQVLAEGLLPMRPALWSVETAPRGALNSSAAHFQSRGLNLSKTKQTEMMHPKQKLIFQSMTPEEKLKVALRLMYSSRELKAAGLRVNHPNWTEEEIRKKVREIFLYART